jgi:hypothetical protein
VGYFYGITRANFLDGYVYFLFDAAVCALYLGQFVFNERREFERVKPVRVWVICLIGWAVVMFLMPLQHPLIQLVGLRGSTLFVPFLLLGGRLSNTETGQLALGIAVLNLFALLFALGEFVLGVPAFYPYNAVTEIIYRSNDVANHTAFRIPATFAHAHVYAGTMLATIPLLFGGVVQPRQPTWKRLLLLAGLVAALLGIFLSAARSGVILAAVLLLVATFSGALRVNAWLAWIALLLGVGYLVSGEERLQRFTSLQNADALVDRIAGSVNLNFLELLFDYPMGNGLGGGGTSLPADLVPLLHNPIGLENEYSRLLLELGLVGLLLWVAFFVWLLWRSRPTRQHAWWAGCSLMWWLTLITVITATLGTGMMTAVPQSVLMFLSMGFLVSRSPKPAPRPATLAMPDRLVLLATHAR